MMLKRASEWSPVINRALLWVGIAVLTDFRHNVGELSKKIATGGAVTGLEWVDVVVGAALAGFVALRIFLDQTYSRHVADKADKAKVSESEFFRQQAGPQPPPKP